jgi:hypothetical protein
MTSITVSEILEAIQAASKGSKDAKGFATVAQIERESGLCRRTIMIRLREVHLDGRLECRKVDSVGIDGRRITVPAYRVIKGKAK